jgi:DNA topoisomerase-3
MELKMKAICEGRLSRQQMLQETIEQYRSVYMRTQQRLDVLRNVCSARFGVAKNITDI